MGEKLVNIEILQGMSHEVRTLLNTIVGLSEDINGYEDIPEEISEDAEDLLVTSKKLLKLVEKIIDFSKIESNEMTIVNGPYKPKVIFEELAKINRVIKKIIPEAPHETLLVIDATTGQNGISQAKSFKEITDITGIVLTKLDGTAKGGIVLAIKESVDIPVKYVGMGEKEEDLRTFDIEKYIYGLFKEMM